jgi:hypothetical protein
VPLLRHFSKVLFLLAVSMETMAMMHTLAFRQHGFLPFRGPLQQSTLAQLAEECKLALHHLHALLCWGRSSRSGGGGLCAPRRASRTGEFFEVVCPGVLNVLNGDMSK